MSLLFLLHTIAFLVKLNEMQSAGQSFRLGAPFCAIKPIAVDEPQLLPPLTCPPHPRLFLKIILSSSYTINSITFSRFSACPRSASTKLKHVLTLAGKFFLSPCRVFQGLVAQREKPQRNITTTCAEILIRRKWGRHNRASF